MGGGLVSSWLGTRWLAGWKGAGLVVRWVGRRQDEWKVERFLYCFFLFFEITTAEQISSRVTYMHFIYLFIHAVLDC